MKIICPNEKRTEHKTFMLRDLDMGEVSSKFDFGFYKGTKRIWVRNDHDFDELIQSLQTKSSTITVWCEGCSKKRKKDSSGSEDESNGTKKKTKGSSDDRMSRVDDITDNLREKHGHMYSNLQYCVWAGGRHASMENPHISRNPKFYHHVIFHQ